MVKSTIVVNDGYLREIDVIWNGKRVAKAILSIKVTEDVPDSLFEQSQVILEEARMQLQDLFG